MKPAARLTDIDKAAFRRDGYLAVASLVSRERCEALAAISSSHLAQLIAPVEYEIDVHYPGAPLDPLSPEAKTSRRLLQAYARDQAIRQWATCAEVRDVLHGLFAEPGQMMLSQCHHNCIMTKTPGYSSVTLWHQDNRYWSFDREDLVSVWLALGDENKRNGCLRVIPGSHRLEPEPGRFDAALFLRPDLPENKTMIEQSSAVELKQGDVLFFHSKLFHAAGRNLTNETKLSLVFTYHQADNRPIQGTRSARFPSAPL